MTPELRCTSKAPSGYTMVHGRRFNHKFSAESAAGNASKTGTIFADSMMQEE